MREFEYQAPSNLDEASRLLAETEDAVALAGGTDILVFLRHGKIAPSTVVDLKRIPGLDAIQDEGDTVSIGAMASMTALMDSDTVQRFFPSLVMAARSMGCWQVRNRATIGGNICNASPSADTAPPLLLYDAKISVIGPRGGREIDFPTLLTRPATTALEKGEILVAIKLPKPHPGLRSTYVRRQIRRSMDIPLVNLAVGLREEGDVVAEARICLGAVAPVPYRATEAESLLVGRPLTTETMLSAAAAAAGGARPITDIRSSADYRTEMVKVFVRRALETLAEGGPR
jgi:carbon-monoxide dehydrogenase medium subunit